MKPERRQSTFRRQLNEGFCAPDGTWSPVKTVAIFGQIVLLWHLGTLYRELITHWDALLLTCLFVIAPDTAKLFVKLKYGGVDGNTDGVAGK